MRSRVIVNVVLLLFVAASVGYLLVKESGGTLAQPTDPAARTEPPPAAAGVVAYYFHGNMRCATCRTLEAYAKEAVEAGFPDALQAGRLQWRTVNIDRPDRAHFVQDFQLAFSGVVLERLAGGERREWKNLERVWELVRGDKEDFLTYVQDEVRTYLEAPGE